MSAEVVPIRRISAFVRWVARTPWPVFTLGMLQADVVGALFVLGFLRFGLPPEDRARIVNEMEPDEAREFLEEMGIAEPGLETLARVGYATLGLQSYLTAGPKESRAWTIRKGATAPEAAGVIHTDFQKGFIKAEIVSFDDLVRLGGMQQAKAAGKVRLEGKDYVMADGDVVEFRFAV